jgi:hypothetical protein
MLAPIEVSHQLAAALLSVRHGETGQSHQETLLRCRDEIAQRISQDPKERYGIISALTSAERSLSDDDLKALISENESTIEFVQVQGGSFRAQVVFFHPIGRIPIENLILGAVPEGASKLHEIWRKYDPEFVVIPDSRGITLKARGRRIIYDLKTLRDLPRSARGVSRVP